MKEHPILFSTEMVRAILDGRKTMTRRIVKPKNDDGEIICQAAEPYHAIESSGGGKGFASNRIECIPCPFGKPGDLLWVREAFEVYVCNNGDDYTQLKFISNNKVVDYNTNMRPGKHPSLHMPKETAQIWLEITDIKVERLQDISPGDACEEGLEYWNIDVAAFEGGELQADFKNYTWTEKKEKDPNYEDRYFPTFASCIDSFRTLWQSINGEENWNVNPWVWVISFKVLSTTGKQNIPNDIPENVAAESQS
jgi:hypothetical protein